MKKICSLILFICGLKSSAEGQVEITIRPGIGVLGYEKLNKINFSAEIFVQTNPEKNVSPTFGLMISGGLSSQIIEIEKKVEDGFVYGFVAAVKSGVIIKQEKFSLHPELGLGILLVSQQLPRYHNKVVIPASMGLYYKIRDNISIGVGTTFFVRPQKDFIPPPPEPWVIEPMKGAKYPDFFKGSLQLMIDL